MRRADSVYLVVLSCERPEELGSGNVVAPQRRGGRGEGERWGEEGGVLVGSSS